MWFTSGKTMPDVTFVSKGRAGLMIRVRPGARRTGIVGVRADRLVIDVAAQPEKGKANKELIRFLAKFTGLRKNQVVIVSGETAKEKRVVFENIQQDALRSAFGLTNA